MRQNSTDPKAGRHLEEAASDFIADRDRLLGFIAGLVSDRGIAEDIFQEVWIRLSRALTAGDPIRNVPAWSRGTARHLILNHWRRTKRWQHLPKAGLEQLIDHAAVAFEQDATPEGIWADRQRLLSDCLSRLTKKSQSVVHLKYAEDYSVDKCAAETGMSPDAVTKMLYRARRSLQKCIEKQIRLHQGLSDDPKST